MPAAIIPSIRGVLCFAFAGCVLAMVACGDRTSSDEYMSRAEQQFEQRNYAEAIIELKNALGAANDQQETLPRARWMLGKSYLETGNMLAAAKELEHARELGWNPNEVLPALAKALLSKGELAQVIELSAAGLDPQAAAQLQAQQALAQVVQGDVWTADTYITKAAEIYPDDTEVQLAEARMLGASGDFDEALEVIQSVLDAQPENLEAWRLKGDLLSTQQMLPQALAAFDVAIALSPNPLEVAVELSPENIEDRFKRALINLNLRQLEGVATELEFLKEIAPEHAMTNYLQGTLDFYRGNYDASIAALTEAEPAAEQYPLILFYLAGAHLAQGNEVEALRQAERHVDLNPKFAPGRILLASIFIRNSRGSDALQALRPVLDGNPTDSVALSLMAKALMLEGKTNQALTMLGAAQQMAPDSAVASYELGAALLLDGQGDAANEQFEAALTLDPTLEQADILRVMGATDISGAIAAAQDYAGRHPESVRAYNLLGQKYLANQQVDEAIAAFNKALSLAPGDPDSNHALAQIEQRAGDAAASRSRYQAVLAGRPDYLPTLLQLAVLAAQTGNEADAVAQLQHAIEAHPDALEPRLMLARHYLRKNTPDKIPPLFDSLPELQQRAPDVLGVIAMSDLAQQRYSKALAGLEQMIQMEPDTTALAHHLLATAAAGAGDLQKARAEFKRAQELDENFVPTLVSLAMMAGADGDAPLFDHYMNRLIAIAPNTPDVLRLQAIAAQRDGETERAIELSRQVLATAPGTAAMLELVSVLHKAGNNKGILEVLQDWVSNNPADIQARVALADHLTRVDQIEQAIEQYREVVKLEPKHADALNNLAWYLREQNPKEALEFARLAVTVNPDRAPLLDTLALVESDAGNHQEALRFIKRAVAASPNNPDLLYHQAIIEARSGNKATAIEILRKVLGVDNSAFTEREQAEQLMASLH
jgi:putative PEP-CTERM system TPR-repeat lipoprotein